MKKFLFLLTLLCGMLIACSEPQNPVDDKTRTTEPTITTETTENDSIQNPEIPTKPDTACSCLCPAVSDYFVENYLPKEGLVYRFTNGTDTIPFVLTEHTVFPEQNIYFFCEDPSKEKVVWKCPLYYYKLSEINGSRTIIASGRAIGWEKWATPNVFYMEFVITLTDEGIAAYWQDKESLGRDFDPIAPEYWDSLPDTFNCDGGNKLYLTFIKNRFITNFTTFRNHWWAVE